MPTMTVNPPAIDRPDSDCVLIRVVRTADPKHQEAVLASAAEFWASGTWPAGLLTVSCFASSDGTSVLSYAQWSSETALRRSLATDAPNPDMPGTEPGTTVPFRLYRVVRGTAVSEHAAAECFPVAFFAMPDAATASRWVDGMLASEEAAEGEERAYPGALAANFHISLDGAQVMVLSEWLSEAEAVAHIEAVWEPILAAAGEGNTGARYRRVLTLDASPGTADET